MKYPPASLLGALCFFALLSPGLVFTPVSAEPGTLSKHVLMIGIDGCRSDALQQANTPNLDSLAAAGVITFDAIAGGGANSSDPTQQATSSGPGWASICTGVWVDKHGVASNGGFSSGNFLSYPHFFKRVHDALPGSFTSSIVQWSPINQSLLVPYPGVADFILNVANSGLAVENAATAHLAGADPNVLFLHFDDVDHAGHATGFSPSSASYIQAIEETDAHIGNVLVALQNRPNYAQEDWMVIATTDHGGSSTSHGGQSAGERRIWLLASGGAAPAGVVVPEGPGHTAATSTALEHLGVAIDPAWGLASAPFGLPSVQASLPSPASGASGVAKDVQLSWFAGADALAHAVYFGDTILLGPGDFEGQQAATSFRPTGLASETTYYWRVDTVTSGGTVPGEVWSFSTSGNPLGGLALVLDFEGDLIDHSGHGNHGTAVGSLFFNPGVGGQAVQLTGGGAYVSLGAADDFSFGASTDFTVALWIRASGWSGDASLVSNKNWASGANVGWILALDPNGTHWQWNYRGVNGTRLDFDVAGLIGDGAWHQIIIAHDRDGDASFYQDGALIGRQSLVGQGNIDSGLPTALGQDGTLIYGIPLAADIDDLRFWQRALSDSEVVQEYGAGAPTFVGSNYCVATGNSAGDPAAILAQGSSSIAMNDVALFAVRLPANKPGVFFTGPLQTSVSFGDGLRCVGGGVMRFNPPVFASSDGIASLAIDLADPTLAALFQAGTTWNFQFWYRDPAGQLTGFNLTDGLAVSWQ
ncbi:MAG: LamG-like jellyroll fold domain-containing protein [bacterium]